ncbi:MAG: hypothetical protein ABSC41_01980 [Acidimicrobiales bacterium]
MGTYECSGLRIASDIPLSAPLVADVVADADQAAVDVTLVLGEPTDPPFERPSEDVVAELAVDGYLWYTFCRVDGGYTGRMPGIADFVIDSDLRRVVCHPAVAGRSQVIPIVVPGTVTAFLLSVGGRFVLHGSAVELGGRSIAFVGASGQGKSTMAAMFCASGASLVTDDVLPLDFGDGDATAGVGAGGVRCIRSGREIRLREKAASLADRFGAEALVRVTADERHAVAPATTTLDRPPLCAVVLPRPDREHQEVRARTLRAGEACFELGRCERIEGWRGRDHFRRQFIDVGRVAATVPVFEVSVPWGPPFAEDLPERVLEACGLDTGLRRLDTRVPGRRRSGTTAPPVARSEPDLASETRRAREVQRGARTRHGGVESGLAYFGRLGDLIDQRWTALGRRPGQLARVATDALREVPVPADLTPEAILGLLAAGTGLPGQRRSSDKFGQPPAVMYRSDNFQVQALTWMDGTTSIHQHGFEGAFRVLQGSSLHVQYSFEDGDTFADRHLVAGRLAMVDTEILWAGDVRPIVAGSDFIHALFHLDRPSVTIVARNDSSDLPCPQYEYRLPGLGVDALDVDDRLRMRMRGLHSLYRLDPSQATEVALDVVGGQDLWTAFRVCDEWARSYGDGSALEVLTRRLGQRHAVLGELLGPVFAEEVRRGRLLARRGMLRESRHRLFLALIINLPDRRSIHKAMQQRYPGQDPDLLIAGWVEELSSPQYRGISGLILGSDELERLKAHILAGETDPALGALASEWRPPPVVENLFGGGQVCGVSGPPCSPVQPIRAVGADGPKSELEQPERSRDGGGVRGGTSSEGARID